MQYRYNIGQKINYKNQEGLILRFGRTTDDKPKYYCEMQAGLTMWITESDIDENAVSGPPIVLFNKRMPHVILVDNFYRNPDEVRAVALQQDFVSDNRFYKGKRTAERFLWPFLKEEFERLLGRQIVDWLNQPANGCFQITGFNDPLVYHSDAQSYAAAIYLTPQAPISAGTSFWRDRKWHARRPTNHPMEFDRYPDDETRTLANNEIYTDYNILHPDNWELVDKVGPVYNRLAIWDAQMIHSASTYEGLVSDVADKARLVQLFFFTVR